MARIRSIKPEYWASEQVMACSRDIRLMFIGMWNFADDAGRMPNSEKTIKAQVFPGDDDISSTNVRGWLDELSSKNLILIYEIDGKSLIQITGWHHQKIDRPRESKIPPFTRRTNVDDSTNTRRALAPDPILSDPMGRDRKGAGETRAPSSNFLSEDWKPSSETETEAKALGLTDADLAKMLRRFGPHYRSRGEKRANWNQQFLAWCVDEADKLKRSSPVSATEIAPAEPSDERWAPIQRQLVEEIGSDKFVAWFKDAIILTMTADSLVIGAPTKFVLNYWSQHYVQKIGAAVRASYPKIESVEFKLVEIAERKTA